MIVVSDASPLIALFQINQLDLLRRPYGSVEIPPAVQREIMPSLGHLLGSLGWLCLRVPVETATLASLRAQVDLGEAEALALALELNALLVIDDLPARGVTQSLGVQATGTVGVLIRAKREGLIEAVAPPLEDLRVAGFWAGEALRVAVLEQAGEA